MKLLFAASELFPLIKTGGLADVAHSLPNALTALQVDVRVVLPAYRQVLAAVDSMIHAWTGAPAGNLCPRIKALEVDKTTGLQPGQKVKASLSAKDPENDGLTYRWVLRADSGTIGTGGDAQGAPGAGR